MQARQIQIRGCLPALVVIVVLGVVLAAALTASVALVAVAAAAGLVAALVRRARGIGRLRDEKTPAERRRAADVTIDAEVVEPRESAGPRPPDRLE
jgi:membrane protein implicated in regulation of membrane protease activity